MKKLEDLRVGDKFVCIKEYNYFGDYYYERNKVYYIRVIYSIDLTDSKITYIGMICEKHGRYNYDYFTFGYKNFPLYFTDLKDYRRDKLKKICGE